MANRLFFKKTPFIITYNFSLVKVQANYRNNNLLNLDVTLLNEIMKIYLFYTLKAVWDNQGKIKMYYGMPNVIKATIGKKCLLRIKQEVINDVMLLE